MGVHNAQNALAAIAAAHDIGVEPKKAIEALKSFEGVARRLEVKGVQNGVTVIDVLRNYFVMFALKSQN